MPEQNDNPFVLPAAQYQRDLDVFKHYVDPITTSTLTFTITLCRIASRVNRSTFDIRTGQSRSSTEARVSPPTGEALDVVTYG